MAQAGELASLSKLQDRLQAQQEDLFRQQQQLQGRGYSVGSDSTKSFTQGLIIGQLSVILVLCIFIKFFVFADSSTLGSTTGTSSSSKADASNILVKRKNNKGDGDNGGEGRPDDIGTILEKTYYDVDNHAPESLDWFNVLIAQTISLLRNEALQADNIYHSLNEFLSKLNLPDYLGDIQMTEIDIGDDFPIFSNCRIRPSNDSHGRLEAKIDVDLSDTLTMGIETKLILNKPRPMTAVLPILLSVSIVRFSGCLTVSLVNTKEEEFSDLQVPKKASSGLSESTKDETNGTALLFSFSPDYRLEFSVKSLIGSRAKLQDVPKISSLIEHRLRSWFVERCIEPRYQVVRLPSLWPRRKNTRQPVHTTE